MLSHTSHSSPYLSIVVASRNDDHGGDLIKRMQIFVDGLVSQIDRFQIPSEIIFVEWNPDETKDRLKDVIRWPAPSPSCTIRIVTVPHSVHKSIYGENPMSFFQMIAKNAGIVRARGKFVLATNVDVIFSNPLMEFLAKQELHENVLYRCDRLDVDNNVPENEDIDSQLRYCATHILRANVPEGTFAVASKENGDPVALKRKYSLWERAWPHALRIQDATSQIIHRPEWSRVRDLFDELMVPFRRFPKLHTNACGDFTLLSREKWNQICGYPELPIYSFHIDSLLLYLALQIGMEFENLPITMPIYHLEHSGGWTPESGEKMLRQKRKKGIASIRYGTLVKWASQLARGRQIHFNKAAFGLPNFTLEETTV